MLWGNGSRRGGRTRGTSGPCLHSLSPHYQCWISAVHRLQDGLRLISSSRRLHKGNLRFQQMKKQKFDDLNDLRLRGRPCPQFHNLHTLLFPRRRYHLAQPGLFHGHHRFLYLHYQAQSRLMASRRPLSLLLLPVLQSRHHGRQHPRRPYRRLLYRGQLRIVLTTVDLMQFPNMFTLCLPLPFHPFPPSPSLLYFTDLFPRHVKYQFLPYLLSPRFPYHTRGRVDLPRLSTLLCPP